MKATQTHWDIIVIAILMFNKNLYLLETKLFMYEIWYFQSDDLWTEDVQRRILTTLHFSVVACVLLQQWLNTIRMNEW